MIKYTNKTEKAKEFEIPKGYKGIHSDIKLKLNSNLGVITGLNGSGKTTLLKYIYEQYKDKSEIFFKTQKIAYFENSGQFRRLGTRQRFGSETPTFDQIYQDIISFFKENNREPYTHHHEVFSMLFDESSTLYEQGYVFLEKISDKILSEFDHPNNIKQRLGVPTDEKIEKKVIENLNHEIKKNNQFRYPNRRGKDLYELYKSNQLESGLKQHIDTILKDTTKELKVSYRKKSSIRNRDSFESYLYELISNNPFSIESIVQQLARRIYEDAKTKGSRTKTKKLWEELNEELQKYRDKKQFNYEVISPSIYSSHYEITFSSSVGGKEIHFDSLSSGEKVIFELICYYFLSKNSNQKLKMIILDEFDANLNPALAEMYLSVVKQQFCEKGIVALLTTHSPSTVVEVEPKNLFSVSVENGIQTIRCAEKDEGKNSILKELAPNFVYYGEFGVLEHVLTDKSNVIIFTEGKSDNENFKSLKGKYTFINCAGAGNIKNFIQCLKSIPFLQDTIKNKVVIALFDFDSEGREGVQGILSSHGSDNDAFGQKIKNKALLFIEHPENNNIFLSMMMPPKEKGWDYKYEIFRHQELKKEGTIGIKRQEELIKKIIQYKKSRID